MAKGFDCATPLTAANAALFASQGFTFVGRYLAQPGSWKRLSHEEARVISDAGLYIVSIFELYAQRAGEGSVAGAADGKLALELAKEVGQPVGSTIYFAVDYDAGAGAFDAIEAYMRAADAQITGYELGVYGSYSVVEAMRERGVTSKLMQTYAWSGGQKSAYANIYQYRNDIVVNGLCVDLDESNGNAGGWKAGMAIQTKSAPTLDEGVATTIINTWISPAWHAESDAKQRDYLHWLANELRKAAGIPEE
jgi:hypothetical protein